MRIQTWVLSGVAMAVLAACGGKTDDNKVEANTVPARSEPAATAAATPSDVAPGASIESAAALALGTTVSGEIKTEEQTSFYKIELEIEPGKDFYLQVAPYASDGKYRLSVTNP
jgi:hypothetical protein